MDNSQFDLDSTTPSYQDWVLIVENVGENLSVQSKEPNNIILEGVCAVFGEMNNNRRVYEKEEYLPHLTYLKEKIAKRQLVGDLDHPPHFDVTLKSASHIIEDLRYDGANRVFIKLRVLEDTPNGKILKALINGGVNVSISSRAAGQVLNEGKVKLHKIFTYDAVGEPGFTEAMLKQAGKVTESLKNDFQMLTESYDHLKASSVVETHNLVNISESLNFADNFKIYKINKNDKEFKSVFESSISKQKNNNTMTEFVTKDQMNTYSEVIKQQIQGIKKELKEQKGLYESASTNSNESDKEVENLKLVGFINYLAESLEGVINYTNYLSKKLNENIRYSEHVAETTNHAIDYSNYIGEKLNQAVKHQDYLGEKINQNINYTEYVKENVNNGLKYMNYLSEELDKSLQYTEYVSEGTNAAIAFGNYLAENVNYNREYAQYIGEKLTQNIGYAEYIAESLNTGAVVTEKRNILNGVSKVDQLVAKVDEAIVEIKSNTAKETLENKYPFLKVMGEANKKSFYALDADSKQAIVETLSGAIWFNESDVVSIMEAVLDEKTKTLPTHIKFMPNEYKPMWDKMNESEKNRIHSKAQLYSINTPYQAKAFWDELDFRGINERIEIEKTNNKITKINESQGTEGLIPVNQVVDMTRGYSQDYIDMLNRQMSYRK